MNFPDENSQDNDLGFEITQDDNLFKLFAEGQSGNETKAVEITKDDPPAPPAKKDPPTKTDDSSADPKKGKDEPPVDTDELKRLMEEDIKGGKGKPSDPGKTDDGDDDDNKSKGEENTLTVVYNEFVEKGILDKLEDFDGTEESLTAAVEATVNNRLADAVDASIDEAFTKNPANAQAAKDLIKFLGNGGKIGDFVTLYNDHGVKLEDLDSEDEAVRTTTAEKVLTNYYKELGWDDARIKRTIDRSKAKGEDILVDEAKDYGEEYKKLKDQKREAAKTELENAETNRKQKLVDFNKSINDAIDQATEIAGFKIGSKKEKEQLKDYLFKPTAELNGKKVPQFLADRHKLQNTPEYLMQQAMWFRNGMKPDQKAAETKVTGSLEKKLSDLQKGKKVSAGGQGTQNTDRKTPGLLDFENLEAINIK